MNCEQRYSIILSTSLAALLSLCCHGLCAQEIGVDQAPQLYDTCIEELPNLTKEQIDSLAKASNTVEELAQKALLTCDVEKNAFLKYLVKQGLTQRQAKERVDSITPKAEALIRAKLVALVFDKYETRGADLMQRSK